MIIATGKNYLKSAAIIATMITSSSAYAQWQGTWDTNYGDVKLHQAQTHVYGDYGKWGTIEGVVSKDRRTVRGVYRRNDDGSKGYFEWKLTSIRGFSGRWASSQRSLPVWNSRGTGWTGTRTSSAKPRFTVYRGSGNMGTFMGGQDGKYTRWINALYSDGTAPDPSSTGQSSTAAAKPKAVNPLAKRFPKLKDYDADFQPRWFHVGINTVKGEQRDTSLYGVMGLYAYCETAGSSRPLKSFGNLKARIFDRTRKDPARGLFNAPVRLGSDAYRKFPMDRACLNDPMGRIKVQIQTNLKEKDPASRDEKFGYRSYHFYIDQIPSADQDSAYINLGVRRSVVLSSSNTKNTGFGFVIWTPPQALSIDKLDVRGSVGFSQ